MKPGTRLRALISDISHWIGDSLRGGCDTHTRPPRWRDRAHWF